MRLNEKYRMNGEDLKYLKKLSIYKSNSSYLTTLKKMVRSKAVNETRINNVRNTRELQDHSQV
jgi:hypothetical protein